VVDSELQNFLNRFPFDIDKVTAKSAGAKFIRYKTWGCLDSNGKLSIQFKCCDNLTVHNVAVITVHALA